MEVFIDIIGKYVTQVDIVVIFAIWLLTQMFKVWDKKNKYEGLYIAMPVVLGMGFGVLLASMEPNFVWQAGVLKGFLMGVFTAYTAKFVKDWFGITLLGDKTRNRK